MVLVLVGKENRRDMADIGAQHLLAEIGSRIDDEPSAAALYHRRGAQSRITRVGGAANIATAAYYGNALRRSGSEESQCHTLSTTLRIAIIGNY